MWIYKLKTIHFDLEFRNYLSNSIQLFPNILQELWKITIPFVELKFFVIQDLCSNLNSKVDNNGYKCWTKFPLILNLFI